MSYILYFRLFTHSGVQKYCVVFFFVLCTQCCQFLWIVNLSLPLQYSLTFISLKYIIEKKTNKQKQAKTKNKQKRSKKQTKSQTKHTQKKHTHTQNKIKNKKIETKRNKPRSSHWSSFTLTNLTCIGNFFGQCPMCHFLG